MYNTQFKVKYNEIEEELIHKLKVNSDQDYEDNSDEEHEYSSEDVIDICNKLYRDELLSVFGSDDFTDDKLNQGMKYVDEKMSSNIEFNNIMDEIKQILAKTFFKNEIQPDENKESIRALILITLFSQNIFYITHKCICQHIETSIIDEHLLVQLRKHSIDLIQKQFGVN